MQTIHAELESLIDESRWVDTGARGLVVGTGLGLMLWGIIGWSLWALLA